MSVVLLIFSFLLFPFKALISKSHLGITSIYKARLGQGLLVKIHYPQFKHVLYFRFYQI